MPAMNIVLRNSKIKSLISCLLNQFPSVKNRLRLFAYNNEKLNREKTQVKFYNFRILSFIKRTLNLSIYLCKKTCINFVIFTIHFVLSHSKIKRITTKALIRFPRIYCFLKKIAIKQLLIEKQENNLPQYEKNLTPINSTENHTTPETTLSRRGLYIYNNLKNKSLINGDCKCE